MKDTPEDVRRAAEDLLTFGPLLEAAMLTRAISAPNKEGT